MPSKTRSDYLVPYFVEIDKTHLLSREEEIALAKKIKMGDQEAKQRFAMANLKLVISIARRYHIQGSHLSSLDLIQEGTLGLMGAIEKFDPDRGCKFSTYAIHCIKYAIRIALETQSRTIRLPSYILRALKLATINAGEKCSGPVARRYIEGALRKEGIGDNIIMEIFNSTVILSLDAPMSFREEGEDHHEIICDHGEQPLEKELEDLLRKEIIAKAMKGSGLTKREKLVLERRFGLNGRERETLKVIGLRMGVSGELIRRIEKDALAKIRKYLEKQPKKLLEKIF